MAILLEEISSYLGEDGKRYWGEQARVFDEDGEMIWGGAVTYGHDKDWAKRKAQEYKLEWISPFMAIDPRMRQNKWTEKDKRRATRSTKKLSESFKRFLEEV